jgi:uncharacterized repeat protein (TIGR03803 family)
VLYSFLEGADATNPSTGVVFGKDGALYGASERGGSADTGAVFRLAPPESRGGAWTETVLYSFNWAASPNVGYYPISGLVVRHDGTLYGTTGDGGDSTNDYCPFGCGVVYSLAPPAVAGADWTYTMIYALDGSSGIAPNGLVSMSSGELFGSTAYGGKGGFPAGGTGTLFRLTPLETPGGSWTPSTVWSFVFMEPYCLIESGGALYGTTTTSWRNAFPVMGTVFQVTF